MATDQQLSEVLSEFARTMVTEFPIQAILDHLVERIVEVMPVTAAGVSIISSDDDPHYVAASSADALRFEELQAVLREGPCLEAYHTDEAVSVSDLRNDPRFPRFGRRASSEGLAAVFAFPLRHGDSGPLGALDLYRDTAGAMDDAAMHAAQTLADVAAAYILNAQVRDDLREASERFRESSLHDPLTGLPNRVLFSQLLEHAVLRTRRSKNPIAVLFADLDRFKEVNDLFGHQVGDELLVAVAQRLTGLLRPGDTLARFAGDEFVILCEELHEASDVEVLANRIDVGMSELFVLSKSEVHVTASVGIVYSGDGDNVPAQILRDADTAMYQAKRRGGARHQILDLREQEWSDSHVILSRDLHGILTRDELATHYQPIVLTHGGRVVGFETLLRWTHPSRGPVSPAILVTLAERSHIIADVGRWVLESACWDRNEWQRASGLGGLEIAVNVSPTELLAGNYVQRVAEVLERCDTDPCLVTLEVTESVFIGNPHRASMVLKDLKRLGVTLALDDFGTGYSSLSYLREFPFDVLKIDRSFVVNLGTDATTTKIVAAIIDLAYAMGMRVVAEGMETAEQYRQIAALDCNYCQGFYFAEPMPADEVHHLLQQRPAEGDFRLPVSIS